MPPSVSRAIVDRLPASGRFVLAGSSASMAEAADALLDRRAGLILHLPARLERELVRTRRGEIQMIFNAEDGAAAGIASAYAQRIVAGYGAELAAGYQAALNLGRQFFGQMGGFGPAGAPPSGEAPPASSAPVVHINIGGGQPTSAPQPSMPQPAMPATPPPLPAPVAAAAPVPATGGGSDWLAALQARQAADVQAQRAAAGVTAPAGGGGAQNGGDQESNRQTTPFSGDDVDQAWAGSGVRTDDGSTL